MKKNYLKLIGSFLFYLLVIIGCRKEIKDQPDNAETQLESKKDHDGHKSECRLVFATNTDPSGSQDFTFHYNKKGLVDVWDIANYGPFNQEYDASGKLKKSIHTENGEVAFTTFFFYKKNKVVKEILYYGTGTEIMDEAYYHYNAQGKIAKVESFINDYVALTKYTPDGNVLSSELFFSGVPVYSAFYTYKQHYKNPYLAVPGIDHAYPYYTPDGFFSSKWQYASLKQVAFDENGNPIVLFEYDPSKTVWQAGPKNYPGLVTYFDLLGAGWFPYRYEFDNCDGRGRDDDRSNSEMAAPVTASGGGKINTMMLLKRNPAKSMKEQVKEFRQQYLNIR